MEGKRETKKERFLESKLKGQTEKMAKAIIRGTF